MAAHDFRYLRSVRRPTGSRVDHLSSLAEIPRTYRGWRDHTERLHILASEVIEAVDVKEMCNLAAIGSNYRFDTFQPAPTWLERHAYRLGPTQVDDLHFSPFNESYFFQSIKALFDHLRQVSPPSLAAPIETNSWRKNKERR